MSDTEIKFVDVSKETKLMMVKLSKDALKASGKVITRILKEKVNVRTGGLRKSIVAWVKIDYKTGQPYMDAGYRSRSQMKKRGVKFFVNPSWFEFGTRPHGIETKQLQAGDKATYQLSDGVKDYGVLVAHPGMSSRNYLKNTVMENIDEIQNAQKECLGQLTDLMIEAGWNVELGGDEEID